MSSTIVANDNIYQRASKLLPADATGAFLAVDAALSQFQSTQPIIIAWITLGSIVLITIILPFYAELLLGITNSRQRLFLSITFLIWAFWMSDLHIENIFDYLDLSKLNDFIGPTIQVLVVIWTVLVVPIAGTMAMKDMADENNGGAT